MLDSQVFARIKLEYLTFGDRTRIPFQAVVFFRMSNSYLSRTLLSFVFIYRNCRARKPFSVSWIRIATLRALIAEIPERINQTCARLCAIAWVSIKNVQRIYVSSYSMHVYGYGSFISSPLGTEAKRHTDQLTCTVFRDASVPIVCVCNSTPRLRQRADDNIYFCTMGGHVGPHNDDHICICVCILLHMRCAGDGVLFTAQIFSHRPLVWSVQLLMFAFQLLYRVSVRDFYVCAHTFFCANQTYVCTTIMYKV